MGKYIEQSLNTDGVELDQFIQGICTISRAGSSSTRTSLLLHCWEFQQMQPSLLPKASRLLRGYVNGACSTFSHGASQCQALPAMLKSSDQKKPHHRIRGLNDEKLAKEKLKSALKCSHCDKTGHTADYCWDLHPELKPDWCQPSESIGGREEDEAWSQGCCC